MAKTVAQKPAAAPAVNPAKTGAAPTAVDPAIIANTPPTIAEAVATDVAGYRIVNGIAIYPILPGNETTVESLLTSLAQDADFQGISMTLFTPVGAKPRILLSSAQGEERLRYAVQKLKTIMSRMGQPHRLVVAAYLREIAISNSDEVGLSWFSNGFQGGVTAMNTSTTTRIWNSDGKTPPNLLSTPVITNTTTAYTVGLANLSTTNVAGVTANLSRTISKGKVIVGSEITIVNGATAELKNDDSMPVPLSGANNTTTFNTQTISSDIKITPTIEQYNAEKPEESIVRLDVVILLSVPTNTVIFSNGSSASEYTTQTLTSTHYVRANNTMFIGGLFASDTWTKSTTGIPVLMNIPILKKFFSSQTTNLEHLASILTMSVRILPVDKDAGYDY